MDALLELLYKYWIFPVGGAIAVAPQLVSFGKKVVNKIKGFKLPKFKAKTSVGVDNVDTVDKDIECIAWLADRAVDVNDQELILELENVNKKFYHIHRNMRKSAVDSSDST